jgi:hypothetical protein
MDAWTIVGYTYRDENYTPAGILAALPTGIGEEFDGWGDASVPPLSTEENLNGIAHAFGIDRQDESSFDSGDFPKVIFASEVEEDDYAVDADGSYVLLLDSF